MQPTPQELRMRALEAAFTRDPVAYGRKVFAVALLGYVYLLGILLLCVGLVVGSILLVFVARGAAMLVGKLVFAALALGYVLIRSVWIRLPAPEGIVLTADTAPHFMAHLDALRRRVRGPEIDVVMITGDHNAAVVEIPLLGFAGPSRRYLILGLPLALSLTPEELDSVLTHEMGHLAGSHGRLGGWLYRVRLTWARVGAHLEGVSSFGGFLLAPFARVYLPWFNAWSFCLARQQEYEADARSREAVGARAAAEALQRCDIMGRWLQEGFWDPLLRRSSSEADLPRPFTTLAAFFTAHPVPEARAEGWRVEALRAQTDLHDTHPCLRERLEALGIAPGPLPPLTVNAADVLLTPPVVAELGAELDRRWQEAVKEPWAARHQEAIEERKRLDALEARAPDTLSPEETVEWARLHEALSGPEAALERWEVAALRAPTSTAALANLGIGLLERDVDRAAGLLDRAMALEPELRPLLGLRLAARLRAVGREEEARTRLAAAEAAAEEEERRQRESWRVDPSMQLDPHPSPDTVAQALQAVAEAHPALKIVWVGRKRLPPGTTHPLLVVGVERGYPLFSRGREAKDAALVQALVDALEAEGNRQIVILDDLGWLRKKLKKLGPPVYRRGR